MLDELACARYKILNPDKLRGSYGKLIHMLQDSVKARPKVVHGCDAEGEHPPSRIGIPRAMRWNRGQQGSVRGEVTARAACGISIA